MRTENKKAISPKLMVALLAAASFAMTPVMAQASDMDPEKKAEQMMKKDAKKMENAAHKAEKMAEQEEHKAEEKAKDAKEKMDD